MKYLARPDASRVALFGSGKQARTNLEGVACVRTIKRACVFSPNPSHRKAFAVEMSGKLGFEVIPASSPEEALRKARAEGAGRELPDDWFSIDLRAWAERGFHPSP